MKKQIKLGGTLLLVAVLLLVGNSCKKDDVDPAIDCNSPNTRDVRAFFATLYEGNNYFQYDTMDLLTHEYTFTVSDDIQICGFAYKSQGTQLFYRIQLVDNNGNDLYNQQLSFDNTDFEYISVPPITVTAGTYTLKRTVVNNINANDVIGPITRAGTSSNPSSPTFPISMGGEITIISSNFYGNGGPVPNYGIPNIYFEYIKL